MKKLAVLATIILMGCTAYSQSRGYLRCDSVYIQGGINAELIILNATRDSTGFLVNKGGGRTEFRRAVKTINDTLWVIGGDTVRVKLFNYVTKNQFLDTAAALRASIASPGGPGGSETDPTVSATVKAITSGDIASWNAKEPAITTGTTGQVILGNKTLGTLNSSLVGLGNVTNTSDANEPISTLQQAGLNLKINYTDSATMLTPYLRKADTANLSIRINSKASQSALVDTTTNLKLLIAGKLSTESDPTVSSAIKAITNGQIANWNTAYGWGNHATAGYLTTFTESDPLVPSHVKSILTTDISSWNAKENALIFGYGLTRTVNSIKVDTSALATKAFVVSVGGGTAPVSSVSGRTGAIVLTKSDVGLSVVDNTNDLSKPISTATQTALNLKVNISDTAAAFSKYLRKSDTAAMLYNYTTLAEARAGISLTGNGSYNPKSGVINIGTSGYNDSLVMQNRGTISDAAMDVSTANGFYSINHTLPGVSSSAMLSFNSGNTSTGPVQMEYIHSNGLRIRNKQDNSYWQPWRLVLDDHNSGAFIKLQIASTGTGISYNNTTGVITGTGIVTETDPLFNSKFAAKTTTDLTEGTNLYFTTARARTSIGATAPLSYNSSTGGLTITQANTSTNGYLSNTDWNTFNSKQGLLINSAGLASALSDETGTGLTVFSNSPTFSGTPSLPIGTISVTQGIGTSNTTISTTEFAMRIRQQVLDSLNAVDTVKYNQVGQGLQVMKSIVGKTITSRTFVSGTNTTVRLVGDTAITYDATSSGSGGDVYSNIANVIVNFGNQTIGRSGTDGAALKIQGPSGTNYLTLGTNTDFGYPEIKAGGNRLDFTSGNQMYLNAGTLFLKANSIIARSGDASSIGTQKGSNELTLESNMYVSGAGQLNWSGIKTIPSLSVEGQYDMSFIINSTGINPDLSEGSTWMTVRNTDRSIRLPGFIRGGTTDSLLAIDATTGLVKKLATISGAGDVFTNVANTIAFNGTQTIQRLTSEGDILLLKGNATNGNTLSLGTNTDFFFNEINSNKRLDMNVTGTLFFNPTTSIHFKNAAIMERVSDATSISTQSGSKPLTFETHTYVGSGLSSYSGFKTMPPTTTAGLYDFGIYAGSADYDINSASPALTIRSTDRSIRFPALVPTVNLGVDSLAIISGTDGQLKKGARQFGTALLIRGFNGAPAGSIIVHDSVGSVFSGSADTLWLPQPSLNRNREIDIHNANASALTIMTIGKPVDLNGGVIYYVGSISLTSLASHRNMRVKCDGDKWYMISNNVTF